MRWSLGINWPHVHLWVGALVAWFGLVGFALLAGPRARPDEVAFAVLLPLVVIVPYALICIGLAALKAWLWRARLLWRPRRLRSTHIGNHRLRVNPRA